MSDAWTLLVEIFDTRAAGQSDRVAVFAGPLGSGKTLGAITYTAMMRSDAGALIVTRRIAKAVEVADAINARGGRAFAWWGEAVVEDPTWDQAVDEAERLARETAAWDELVTQFTNHRLVHRTGWIRSLEMSGLGRPLWLVFECDGDVAGCLPGLLVRLGPIRLVVAFVPIGVATWPLGVPICKFTFASTRKLPSCMLQSETA